MPQHSSRLPKSLWWFSGGRGRPPTVAEWNEHQAARKDHKENGLRAIGFTHTCGEGENRREEVLFGTKLRSSRKSGRPHISAGSEPGTNQVQEDLGAQQDPDPEHGSNSRQTQQAQQASDLQILSGTQQAGAQHAADHANDVDAQQGRLRRFEELRYQIRTYH